MNEGFLLLLALTAGGFLWYRSREAHEKVVVIARRVCRKLGVQPLDDTVALRRLRLAWSRQGPALRRVYGFDFSISGSDRESGEIALVGLYLEWIRVQREDGSEFIELN